MPCQFNGSLNEVGEALSAPLNVLGVCASTEANNDTVHHTMSQAIARLQQTARDCHENGDFVRQLTEFLPSTVRSILRNAQIAAS